MTRLAAATIPLRREGEIEIRYFAKVARVKVVMRWAEAEGLRPFHVLKDEVVRQRFDYDDAPGLHVAVVRVFRLEPAWMIADSKAYGGCRSWVSLPAPPASLPLISVVEDAVTEEKLRAFDALGLGL